MHFYSATGKIQSVITLNKISVADLCHDSFLWLNCLSRVSVGVHLTVYPSSSALRWHLYENHTALSHPLTGSSGLRTLTTLWQPPSSPPLPTHPPSPSPFPCQLHSDFNPFLWLRMFGAAAWNLIHRSTCLIRQETNVDVLNDLLGAVDHQITAFTQRPCLFRTFFACTSAQKYKS